MSEMNLIMESWRGFVNEDDLEACPVPTVDPHTFLDGLELAMMEPEAQKAYIEKLKGSKTRVKNLNRIIEIGSLLTGVAGATIGGFAATAPAAARCWVPVSSPSSPTFGEADKKPNPIRKLMQ